MSVIEINVVTGEKTTRELTAKEQEDINAASLEDAPTYKALRQAEYPPIGDQLDAVMKWMATETELSVPAELKSIAMACMGVKTKYPKSE